MTIPLRSTKGNIFTNGIVKVHVHKPHRGFINNIIGADHS